MFEIGLALGASVAWGGSDFLGGVVSRRLPVAAVLLAAQAVGLLLAAAAWALAGASLPGPQALAMAAGAGLAELAGFACLYRGLATAQMSVVAPLAALTGVPPLIVGVAAGEPLPAAAAAGVALAVAGTALCAFEPGGRRPLGGVVLGLAAALAFGAFLIGLGHSGEQAGPGAVLAGRAASVTALLVLVACRRRETAPAGTGVAPVGPTMPARADLAPLAALGGLDVLANLAYVAACGGAAQGLVAVLGSLYPLTTVLLARTVLDERLGRARGTGVAAVLTGIALIAMAGA
jgi:drug/metabolite transporter (DMT)-like permease